MLLAAFANDNDSTFVKRSVSGVAFTNAFLSGRSFSFDASEDTSGVATINFESDGSGEIIFGDSIPSVGSSRRMAASNSPSTRRRHRRSGRSIRSSWKRTARLRTTPRRNPPNHSRPACSSWRPTRTPANQARAKRCSPAHAPGCIFFVRQKPQTPAGSPAPRRPPAPRAGRLRPARPARRPASRIRRSPRRRGCPSGAA